MHKVKSFASSRITMFALIYENDCIGDHSMLIRMCEKSFPSRWNKLQWFCTTQKPLNSYWIKRDGWYQCLRKNNSLLAYAAETFRGAFTYHALLPPLKRLSPAQLWPWSTDRFTVLWLQNWIQTWTLISLHVEGHFSKVELTVCHEA